ncbi:claudin domain-containing protein 2 isoform 1-T1 [Molossus nigricans]
MGMKRSLQCGGTLLGFLANILTILSSAANYWIRFPKGHSGLWQDCIGGICTNVPCESVLAVTQACMVLAAAFGIVGLVLGLRIVYHDGDTRGQTTSAIFLLCGLLLLIALISYTAKNAWKSDVFFSWSYFSAWLAFPLYVIAGNLDSGKRVEENTPGTLLPAETPQLPIQETPLWPPGNSPTYSTPDFHNLAKMPLEPQTPRPGPVRPSAPGPTALHPPSCPLPSAFCFLLADMILQSTDAISGFPVCL